MVQTQNAKAKYDDDKSGRKFEFNLYLSNLRIRMTSALAFPEGMNIKPCVTKTNKAFRGKVILQLHATTHKYEVSANVGL